MTDRLRLRRVTLSHLPDILEMNKDPDVMRYIAQITDFVKQKRRLRQVTARAFAPGEGAWAISLRAQPRLMLGIVLLRRHGNRIGEFEIAYMLKRIAWGQGIATEAAIRLLLFGIAGRFAARYVGTTELENHASQNVLRKTGMTRLTDRRLDDEDVSYFQVYAGTGLRPNIGARTKVVSKGIRSAVQAGRR